MHGEKDPSSSDSAEIQPWLCKMEEKGMLYFNSGFAEMPDNLSPHLSEKVSKTKEHLYKSLFETLPKATVPVGTASQLRLGKEPLGPVRARKGAQSS